jgi:Xaa-Pro dipeptidase
MIDLQALARDRSLKVDRAVERAGADALVLFKSSNVRYATGAHGVHSDSSRERLSPSFAIVVAGRPATLPPSFFVDDAEGASRVAAILREAVGPARRIGIDRWTVPLRAALRREFPQIEWIDADAVLAEARMTKLPSEIALLRRAQELNEQAMQTVLDALRPGMREIDLTAIFHRVLGGLGVTDVHVESVWCALPRTRDEAPWSLRDGFPYRELTSDRVLGEGDLVAIDTGILHEGYMSDFGRTWICGAARPRDDERRVFAEWREVLARLIAACRPGRSALDLRRAALSGWTRAEPPWPLPLYVAHSLGVGGVEPPFVGTDLGEAAEERWILGPGMVIVFEPYVWEEGVGGYRAEETVVVTDTGCEPLTRFTYGMFET